MLSFFSIARTVTFITSIRFITSIDKQRGATRMTDGKRRELHDVTEFRIPCLYSWEILVY